MRRVEDEELVAFNWQVDLHRQEELILSRAGEDGDAACRRAHFFRKIFFDALSIAPETLAFGRARFECFAARRELTADEAIILVAPVLVRLRVEIKTDDGQPARIKLDETMSVRRPTVVVRSRLQSALLSDPFNSAPYFAYRFSHIPSLNPRPLELQ